MTKLTSLIPSVQAWRLHRIANSEDETIRNIALANNIEEEFQNLWVTAGGKEDEIPRITDLASIDYRLPRQILELLSKWEKPAPKKIYPIPCNWRETELAH